MPSFPPSREGNDRCQAATRVDDLEGRLPLAGTDCLFCRIVAGEIPADVVLSTPDLMAFRDINPQAPTHILIIPKAHVASVSDLDPDQAELMGKLFLAARELAEREGIAQEGYRMVVNAGAAAGQTVFHIHMHLLGGRGMAWPPG
jgi:histidine triad (HIT) family protein